MDIEIENGRARRGVSFDRGFLSGVAFVLGWAAFFMVVRALLVILRV